MKTRTKALIIVGIIAATCLMGNWIMSKAEATPFVIRGIPALLASQMPDNATITREGIRVASPGVYVLMYRMVVLDKDKKEIINKTCLRQHKLGADTTPLYTSLMAEMQGAIDTYKYELTLTSPASKEIAYNAVDADSKQVATDLNKNISL